MCGIAGATRGLLGNSPKKTLQRMNEVMLHRGPDMGEILYDDLMGLCHRRLSIIDLSEDGRQPMSTPDGRYSIVFNGEIYNFQELRRELCNLGYTFHSKTDTEVLLYLFVEFGPSSLTRLRGMFAYVIWDKKEKKLFGARDRIGKKPLYYYRSGSGFAFASELKSLLTISCVPRKVDQTAFLDYLHYLFIPHPKTIYQDIFKLEPGQYFIWQENSITLKYYWDVDFSQPLDGSSEEIAEKLLAEVREATDCRLISDVPLGAFLSGGIDSSGIVALMAEALNKPVSTCSIGFHDKSVDEAVDASKFANLLQTNHHEHYIQDEPERIIRKLVYHFDEPFSDSSMVPTYYVSHLARKHVTVALSGDGGDENFAGYQKYSADLLENRIRSLFPHYLLETGARCTGRFQTGVLKRLHSLLYSTSLSPEQAFFLTNTFITGSQLQDILSDKLLKVSKEYDPGWHISRYYRHANGPDHLARILYTDLKLYLPGDILVKVDRMSMANSLEVRSPLLDHKLIEFAARIPSSLKIRKNEKKYILKKSFKRILPPEILKRRKHGFVVPLGHWFRFELREMAESSIFNNDLMADYFNMGEIGTLWSQHQQERIDHGTLLWTIFIFSLWLEETIGC